MEFAFSSIRKGRLNYFCRSNCYPSDSALWCLCPKLILFILELTALVSPDRPAEFYQFLIQQQLSRFKWGMTIQTGSCCAVDMIDHPCGILLGKVRKMAAFWKDITEEFMILFQSSFLPGGHRGTVVYVRILSIFIFSFKDLWIFKGRVIVCEDHRKQPSIGLGSQFAIKEIENFSDGFPAVSREQKDQHKRTAPEQKCQENLSAFPASSFHNVHLHYGRVRTLCHIEFKISISTSFHITWDFSVFMALFSRLIMCFSRKVQVDDGKKGSGRCSCIKCAGNNRSPLCGKDRYVPYSKRGT